MDGDIPINTSDELKLTTPKLSGEDSDAGHSSKSDDTIRPGEEGRWDHDKAQTLAEVSNPKQYFSDRNMQNGESQKQAAIIEYLRELELPEKIYDSNPELFKTMSAEQFIKAQHEILTAIREVEVSEKAEADLKDFILELQRCDVYKEIIPYHRVEWAAQYYVSSKTVLQEINRVYQDSYNKTPKQLMRECLAIFQRDLQPMHAEVDKRKEAAKPVLAKYGIKPEVGFSWTKDLANKLYW